MSEPPEPPSRGEGPSGRERDATFSGRRIAAVTALLAASVLLSRLLGFARDAVLAFRFGVGPEADAYSAAFMLPDLLNYFLAGGALSIAFVPLYARARSRRGEAAAAQLLATVLGTVGTLAVVATVVLWWLAEPLIGLLYGTFDPAQQAQTASLTRIVLPAQICFICGGILRGALMARGRFLAQAAAPLIYNAAIISGGIFLAPTLGVAGFAWGALVGAALGPLGIAVLEARGRLALRLRVAPLDREFLAYLVVALPLMMGVTLLSADEWYDRWFGQFGGEGVIIVLAYARRLMQLPIAAVGQTLRTASYPALSALVSEGRQGELSRLVQRTLQAALGLGLLGGAALFCLAEPLTVVVYLRGAFVSSDVDTVARVLRVLAFAVPGWMLLQVAVNPFYARGDTWRPMLLGTAVAVLAFPLYWALGRQWGAEGLAAAGVVAISVNGIATVGYARRRHGAPRILPLLEALGRISGVALAAGAATVWLQSQLEPALPLGEPWKALVQLAVGVLAFSILAASGLGLFGDEATRGAASRLLRAALKNQRT